MTIILSAPVMAASAAPATQPATHVLRVAIYDDGGGSRRGTDNVQKCLGADPIPASPAAAAAASQFKCKSVTADDLRNGALDNVDVLVQPGGSGSKQALALGEDGRAAIKKFVENGGGYVGICAGAYLATSDYEWSLHILNAKVVDRKHWARGSGFVKLRVTDLGKKMLGISDDLISADYNQGPLLAPATQDDLPKYQALALFETEIAEKGAPSGVMPGTTAIAMTTFGKGRVIVLSPHLERSPGLDGVIRHAVKWVGGEQ